MQAFFDLNRNTLISRRTESYEVTGCLTLIREGTVAHGVGCMRMVVQERCCLWQMASLCSFFKMDLHFCPLLHNTEMREPGGTTGEGGGDIAHSLLLPTLTTGKTLSGIAELGGGCRVLSPTPCPDS